MCAIVFVALFGYCIADSVVVDKMCEDRGQTEFFPVPGSCRNVYLCYQGKLHEQTCPDNLWWNAAKGFCTYRQLSGCTMEEIKEPITTTPIPEEITTVAPLECTELEITLYPHEEVCNRYYICGGKGKEPIEAECSTNYQFNPETSQCVPFNKLQCVDKVPQVKCPADLKDGQVAYLAHPSDCFTYYLCVNQSQLLFTCKDGLMWNASVNSCDVEEKATCDV